MSIRSTCVTFLGALLLAASVGLPACLAAGPISFLPPVQYAKPGVSEVRAADMDGDGRMDLVAVGTDGVSVLYGKGDGTFDARVDYPLASGLGLANHIQIAIADLNGDGAPDLIIPIFGANRIVVLMNRRDRTFAPAVSYPVGANPDSLVAGDFNNDGRPDVAVSNLGEHDMAVLLNRGDGTLQPPVFYPGVDVAGGMAAADFNGDGNLDLVMSSFYNSDCVIYLGDGSGKFPGGGRFHSGGDTPARLVADDFDGDGKPDLAIANYHSGNVSILLGDGSGAFGLPSNYAANTYPFVIAAADLDGDGDPDLVLVNATLDYFTVLENAGDGSFLPPVQIPSGGTGVDGLAVGDFDGDGRPDVAVANAGSSHISVFLNNSPRPNPAIRSLVISPSSAIGGCDTMSGMITLTAPAPPGGVTVTLVSTNPAVMLPASVKVPAGATSISFTPSLSPVTTAAAGTITASLQGSGRRASVTVRPGGVALLKLTPGVVIGGRQVSGEVDFTCPAGAQGLTVMLASSQPAVVPVPATVTAAPGATGASFSLVTQPVNATTSVTITAIFGGVTRTASVEVRPVPPPPPPPPPVNLLVNGSFEDPDTSSSTIGWLTYGPADVPGKTPTAAGIPGWKITQGTVSVVSWYWKAAVGRQSLDLVGDNQGTIEQSFATDVGKEYIFSGVIAHHPANFYLSEGRGNVFVNRTFLIQLLHQDPSATVSEMHWIPFSVRFKATASMTTLTISDATGSPFPGGLVVDDLAVTPG